MTGVPFLAGVATFLFSTASRQTLGLIQHPPSSHGLRVYSTVPPLPHMFQSMKFNEAYRHVYIYFL